MIENDKKQYRIGMACAIISAIIWGVLPIYWKNLDSINSFVIIFYRLVLAFLAVLIVALIKYKPGEILAQLKQKGLPLVFFLAGFVISINWSTYIWAVNAGHIIQTSIGYYIEPLFVALMGSVVFREKLNVYKVVAMVLALIGVCIMIISYGQPPFIALGLALSFSIYAGIKRKFRPPAIISLLYETGFMVPFAIPLIIIMENSGRGAFAAADTQHLLMLSFIGVLTATPLILFGLAANRIPILTLGLVEYISPSLNLLIGILIYREPFDLYQFIGFIVIWVGLTIFTIGEIKSYSSGGEDVERL